jgi:hypothetical protein
MKINRFYWWSGVKHNARGSLRIKFRIMGAQAWQALFSLTERILFSIIASYIAFFLYYGKKKEEKLVLL